MRFPISPKVLMPALGVGVVVLGAVIAERWLKDPRLTKTDYVGTIDVSADDAFDILRRTSQQTNVKVADVAADVVRRHSGLASRKGA